MSLDPNAIKSNQQIVLGAGLALAGSFRPLTVRLYSKFIAPDGWVYYVNQNQTQQITGVVSSTNTKQLDPATNTVGTSLVLSTQINLQQFLNNNNNPALWFVYDQFDNILGAFRTTSGFQQQTENTFQYQGEALNSLLNLNIINTSDDLPMIPDNSMPLWVESSFTDSLGNPMQCYADFTAPQDTTEKYIIINILNSKQKELPQVDTAGETWSCLVDDIRLYLVNCTMNDAENIKLQLKNGTINQTLPFAVRSGFFTFSQSKETQSETGLKANIKETDIEIWYWLNTSVSKDIVMNQALIAQSITM